MRKFLSMTLAIMMCLSLITIPAFAAEPLPTEISAPSSVILSEGTDSGHACVRVTFNKDAVVAELATLRNGPGANEKYGVRYFEPFVQFDWSLDSQSDWKYANSWDECKRAVEGHRENVGEYTTMSLFGETTQYHNILNICMGGIDDTMWKNEWKL